MQEYAVFAAENADYVDEASGKRVHVRYLIGGKFLPNFLITGRIMKITVLKYWL